MCIRDSPGIVLMAAAFLTGEQIGYGDAAVVTLMGLVVTADIVCLSLIHILKHLHICSGIILQMQDEKMDGN